MPEAFQQTSVHGLTRSRRLTWRSICAGMVLPLLMVFMQQAAVLHELGHLTEAEAREASGPYDGAGQHGKVSHPCLECLAFAQAASGTVALTFSAVLLTGLAFQLVAARTLALGALTLPAQRSRGPPIAA
ncbi:MAG TPA: hypothetical protein VHA82_11870 [Ramlibacter sp.]|uniref:hypothetical protein n=1 Tax=Ramlibacter sp. TaxID=1917967 RepID=UPI002CE1ECAA|nr:hypothetical protein [Ramlibacter sp.]HVZ44499.1 hypothetical protein [Ramlibacter sp.]